MDPHNPRQNLILATLEPMLPMPPTSESMKQQEFFEKRFAEINDLKNQRQEKMLEKEKVSFEEVEEWGNKYRDAVRQPDVIVHNIGKNEKTECGRAGQKKNGADDNGDATAYEEERRRQSYKTRL